MKRAIQLISLLIIVNLAAHAQDAGRQQFASLDDFKLESGEVIRDCRIGYRALGTLNSAKSNIIIFPTWFGGTSEQAAGNFGPGGFADPANYYIILLDALGDGISSSPSNSPSQPRMKFPAFTIADMVNSQHELLTRILHIDHVKTVMGASMGGMQTFQWMVSYPDFMDKAIPVVGSPRLAPYDLVLWQSENDAITTDPAWKDGQYTEQPGGTLLAEISTLIGSTPDKVNRDWTREKVSQSTAQSARKMAEFDASNRIRQAQAMMTLDISKHFDGSMEKAAAAVKAKVLVIVSATDHVVTPGPAMDFANLLHSQILELQNNCGHGGPSCDSAKVDSTVASFLSQ